MSTETIFWACAIVGSGFFLSKVLLALVFGMDSHDAHGANDVHLHDAQGTEGAFKIFSFYSIGAFLMMFGWVGLAAQHQFALGESLSLILGTIVGAIIMWLTAKFFSSMQFLTSTGSKFEIEKTRGLRGNVYERIPGGEGRGVVQLTLDGMSREIEAVADQAIESFTTIEVVSIKDPKTVIVRRVA